MLIVIVIIGILAAALIPQLTGIQGRARDTGRKADMNNIAGALQNYQLDYNNYPPANSGDNSGGTGAWYPLSAHSGTLAPTYIGILPEESGKGNMPYVYGTVQSNNGFVLGTVSEGGKTNANWDGGTGSVTPTGIQGYPTSISGHMSKSSITDMANAIAACASQDADATCRGNAKDGTARYLIAN